VAGEDGIPIADDRRWEVVEAYNVVEKARATEEAV
jgi:hypothetical protein